MRDVVLGQDDNGLFIVDSGVGLGLMVRIGGERSAVVGGGC